jgi:hypothetical protein
MQQDEENTFNGSKSKAKTCWTREHVKITTNQFISYKYNTYISMEGM